MRGRHAGVRVAGHRRGRGFVDRGLAWLGHATRPPPEAVGNGPRQEPPLSAPSCPPLPARAARPAIASGASCGGAATAIASAAGSSSCTSTSGGHGGRASPCEGRHRPGPRRRPCRAKSSAASGLAPEPRPPGCAPSDGNATLGRRNCGATRRRSGPPHGGRRSGRPLQGGEVDGTGTGERLLRHGDILTNGWPSAPTASRPGPQRSAAATTSRASACTSARCSGPRNDSA